MTVAPPERSRGSVIGSYELVKRIGAGGMGEVWKARDRLLDRLVALKFLTGPASPRRDLLHEARAASSLNHPNIVTIDTFERTRNATSLDFILVLPALAGRGTLRSHRRDFRADC